MKTEEKDKNNNIKGILGTLLFHAVLVFCLIFYGLTTPLPLPEEQGVEVNLGNSNDGMGQIQPKTPALASNTSVPKPSVRENLLTSESEETVKLKNVDKKHPEVKPEQKTEPIVKPTPEVKPVDPVVDPNALYKGKSKNSSNGGNEGITGKPGDQGSPNGDPNSKNYNGNPGPMHGISFSLEGRTAKTLPKPTYNSDAQGRVVVTVTVDKNGVVTKAIAGAKGTQTSAQELWKAAEQAAYKAKFDFSDSAPEEQKGTITYNFIRLN